MPNTVIPLPSATSVEDHLGKRRWQLCCKRFLDVVFSLFLIVVLSPVLFLTALCIRLESRGPVLFAQPRWGLRERVFWCLKFRSMYVVSPNAMAGPTSDHPSGDGYLAKTANDPRVTRIGRMLRRTSIDELPQLWNVLIGDMSLVGPRPLMLHMLEPYPEIRAIRCKLRPGITGLWQVQERANNTHVDSMLPYDTEYLFGVSLALDAKILLQTVRVVITGQGAI